jgi:hypothetical protein
VRAVKIERAGPRVEAEWVATMHDLKIRLAALLDTQEGKALIEQGECFLRKNCTLRSLNSWRRPMAR